MILRRLQRDARLENAQYLLDVLVLRQAPDVADGKSSVCAAARDGRRKGRGDRIAHAGVARGQDLRDGEPLRPPRPEHLKTHAEQLKPYGTNSLQRRSVGENRGCRNSLNSGGERGIRTPGTASGTTDFESAAFDHSAISPNVHEAIK